MASFDHWTDSGKPLRLWRRFSRLPLLVVFLLVSLWTGVFWSFRSAEQQGLAQLQRETSALSYLFANHVDVTFRTMNLGLAELREAWLKGRTGLNDVIDTHVNLLPGAFVQSGITDAQGNVVSALPTPVTKRVNIADRDYFRAHLNTDRDVMFVGRPIVGRISGKWSIPMSRPIFRNGKFDGVVYITADPDYFVNFYWVVDLGRNGAAVMVRDTGEVMALSSDSDKYLGQVINPTPYANPEAPLRGHFMRETQTDGAVRLVGYARLPEYGLTVMIGPELNEAMSMVRDFQRKEVGAAVLLSVLILLMAWVMRQAQRRDQAASEILAESEERFRALFGNMLEGVALYSLEFDTAGKAVDYRVLQVNPAFERQTGMRAENVVGRCVTEIHHTKEAPFLDICARVAMTGVAHSFEHRFEALGRDFAVQVVSPKLNQFATVFEDITERKILQRQRDSDMNALQDQYRTISKLHAQLADQVVHDPLTGLHNRRFLDDMLPRELARAAREGYAVAFIMLDLDKFKLVNDTYGHSVGDRVLVTAADVLRRLARESDLVCRYGGEEFLVIMPRMTLAQGADKANTYRQAIADSVVEHNGQPIRMTISAGVAAFPQHGSEVDGLVSKADAALYAAKANGRNRVEVCKD